MNCVFRQGMFDWSSVDGEAGDEILKQLQLLFAQLQLSQLKSIDPSGFTRSISLQSNIQQDPQE